VVATIWGEVPAGMCTELRSLGKERHRLFLKPGASAAGWIRARDGASDLYFGVGLREEGAGGAKAAVTRLGAVWIDVDVEESPAELKERLKVFPLLPSHVVFSGHGHHLYWLLRSGVGPEGFGRVEALNRRLAASVGGDVKCYDAARIMRLPGTMNVKKEPVLTRVVRCQPDVVYDLEELEAALPEAVPVASGSAPPGEGVGVGERGPFEAVAEGERNDACFRLACELKGRGLTAALALGALMKWNEGNVPALPGDEVTAVCDSAYRGVGEPLVMSGEQWWTAEELVGETGGEVEFVVEGLVPSNGVTILSGEGGIGKSFIALDIALCVAGGGTFAKLFECRRGPVLYIDLENDDHTLGSRIRRMCVGRGIDVKGLPIVVPKRYAPGVCLVLDTVEGRAWLRAAVRKYQPTLTVVDSLIAAHYGDENSNPVMRQFVGGLDAVAREGGMGVLVVHHQRKRGKTTDAGQLMRGASDLRNSVVSHFACRKGKNGAVIVEHDKCRPAQEVETFALRLRDVGDTALVVEFVGRGEDAALCGDLSLLREKAARELLGQGPQRMQALQNAMECPLRTAHRTMAALVESGDVERLEEGRYALVRRRTAEDEETRSMFDEESADSGKGEGNEDVSGDGADADGGRVGGTEAAESGDGELGVDPFDPGPVEDDGAAETAECDTEEWL